MYPYVERFTSVSGGGCPLYGAATRSNPDGGIYGVLLFRSRLYRGEDALQVGPFRETDGMIQRMSGLLQDVQ